MLEIWTKLGARWEKEKSALEIHVRTLESEIQRLFASPATQATPIEPEEPDVAEASLPIPPHIETAVVISRLPAPPRRESLSEFTHVVL